ncbi:hypothetical protein ONR57_08835 [Hoyosella sp. YIM 151337]|uniref:hypothetical protein n=1 Tax=Hoyosella sp. YIM 151337 TaxID=2992742 RepID=UPI002236313E|nr:hypothetical protein [Hoyosella sp. YIM 151337]MCW4353401.1 hypothetical protein [Hoyosella sp. YIM 151337]
MSGPVELEHWVDIVRALAPRQADEIPAVAEFLYQGAAIRLRSGGEQLVSLPGFNRLEGFQQRKVASMDCIGISLRKRRTACRAIRQAHAAFTKYVLYDSGDPVLINKDMTLPLTPDSPLCKGSRGNVDAAPG